MCLGSSRGLCRYCSPQTSSFLLHPQHQDTIQASVLASVLSTVRRSVRLLGLPLAERLVPSLVRPSVLRWAMLSDRLMAQMLVTVSVQQTVPPSGPTSVSPLVLH